MKLVLLCLKLRNLALIESLDLSFDSGLTVLTGETGAGKSLVIDALDTLLGSEQFSSTSRLIRSGSKFCLIEGTFSINSSIQSWIDQNDFIIDNNELIISREWTLKKNRFCSRTRLNGVVINKQQLMEVRPLLIDVTAQGQSQEISSPIAQLRCLDCFGSDELKFAAKRVKKAWQNWQTVSTELQKARISSEQLQENLIYLQSCLEELESADLIDPHEDKKLQQEQDRLVYGVKLQEGVCTLLSYFQDRVDSFPSILDQLGECINQLHSMSQLDPSLSIYLEKAYSFQSGLQDLSQELEKYGYLLESDPHGLVHLQERLSVLKRLQRRYNLDLPNLLIRRDELRNNILDKAENKLLERLEIKEKLAREERDKSNIELSVLRKKFSVKLRDQLLEHLRPLGLSNVRFDVNIESAKPTERGKDFVQFLFSANPGQPLCPMTQIASGGEMSRFLLALKTILAQEHSSTLLFDEIDSGVSGRVSSAIANSLKKLALNRQVFCVTHQPLVAAQADHHFSVTKSVVNGKSTSKVTYLSDFKARQYELAELAGGDLQEARAYAASLLDSKVA